MGKDEILDWTDIVPSILKYPIKAYKNRHSLQYWWKKTQVFLNSGDTNIVILGRPNVGKSVMVSYLYGESSNFDWQLPTASKTVETKAMKVGKWTNIIRVIPGQKMQERSQGLDEAFNESEKLEGIIYVADWGYNDVRNDVVKEKMIKEEKIDTIKNLRIFNLKQEIEDLKLICNDIERAFARGNMPKWFLIVVNKCDLFFENSELMSAQKYYHPDGDSEFSMVLQKTLNHVGRQNLKCASIPLCSFEKDLNWNQEIKKAEIGGEESRKALAMNFFQTISNF